MIHEVKVIAEQFERIISGERLFIATCDNDTPFGFEIGDLLALNELMEIEHHWETTGRSCVVSVSEIDRRFSYKGEPCAVMSIKPCAINKMQPFDLVSGAVRFGVPLATGRRKDGADNAAD